jgi:hypothetical protein
MPTTDRPADTSLITTRQMRELHALLHEHGISGDRAVHGYLEAALREMGAEPVESRSKLTTVQAAHIIADLETAEAPTTTSRMTPSKVRALRAEFPVEAQGKLPRSTCKACSNNARKRCDEHQWVARCDVCRGSHSSATMHIDFVGHADVTARLLDVDPHWFWRPWSTDEVSALPPSYRNGLWVWLNVLGVERAGFGHAENDRQKGGDEVKVAIGDALRNAAMRFGVALDLWAKGDRDWSAAAKADGYDNPPMDPAPPRAPEADQAQRPWNGPNTPTLLLRLDEQAQRAGVTYELATAKWRKANGDLSLDALDTLDPWVLAPLVDAIEKRADEVVAEQEEAQRRASSDAATAEAKAAEGNDTATADPSAPDDPWATPTATP